MSLRTANLALRSSEKLRELREETDSPKMGAVGRRIIIICEAAENLTTPPLEVTSQVRAALRSRIVLRDMSVVIRLATKKNEVNTTNSCSRTRHTRYRV